MKHFTQIQVEFAKIATKWVDLSIEFQKAYLKRHPNSKRRLTSHTKKNKSSESEIADYFSDEKRHATLSKLLQYIQKEESEVKFSSDDLNTLNNTPGLPNRINEVVYRGIHDVHGSLASKLQAAHTKKKNLMYKPKMRQFSSWSMSKKEAEQFGSCCRSSRQVKNTFAAVFKAKIQKDTKYIDVFHITDNLQKYYIQKNISTIFDDSVTPLFKTLKEFSGALINSSEEEVILISKINKVKVTKLEKCRND